MRPLFIAVYIIFLPFYAVSQIGSVPKDIKEKNLELEKRYGELLSRKTRNLKQFLDSAYTKELLKHPYVQASKFKNLGIYQQLKNNSDSAIFYYLQCEKLARKQKYYQLVGMTLHNRGIIADEQGGQLDSIINIAKESIVYLEKANDKETLNKATNSLASRLGRKGLYSESNNLLFSMLTSVQDQETKGVIYNSIASNYNDLDISPKAEQYYLKAIETLKKSAKDDKLLYRTYHNTSSFYNSEEQYEKAMIYADSILKISINDDAILNFNLSRMVSFQGLKKWDSAIHYANKIIAYDQGSPYYLSIDYRDRGQIYLDKGDNNKALVDFKKAISLRGDTSFSEHRKQLLRDYITSYLRVNNVPVQKEFEQFVEINDSITNESINRNTLELESKYQSKIKEAQISEQATQIELREKQNWALGIGVLLALLVASVLWYLYRKNKKQKEIIDNQKGEILHFQRASLIRLNSIYANLKKNELLKDQSEDAQKRILALSTLQELLYGRQGEKYISGEAELTEFLRRICSSIEAFDKVAVIHYEPQEPIVLRASVLRDTALIINELITNSIRHAFADISNPRIELQTKLTEDNKLHIHLSDNGKGLPQNFSLKSEGDSMGLEFIKQFIKQYKGTIENYSENGAHFKIALNI